MQQLEELEKEFVSNQRGVRVELDNERFPPMAQVTVIKNEHQHQSLKQISSKTSSELNSPEKEYIVTFQGNITN